MFSPAGDIRRTQAVNLVEELRKQIVSTKENAFIEQLCISQTSLISSHTSIKLNSKVPFQYKPFILEVSERFFQMMK